MPWRGSGPAAVAISRTWPATGKVGYPGAASGSSSRPTSASAGWAGNSVERDEDRFVVLIAGAFGRDEGVYPTDPWPVVPWIRIDEPGRVATCLRRSAKEVSLGQ